jgi:hypothetical protein
VCDSNSTLPAGLTALPDSRCVVPVPPQDAVPVSLGAPGPGDRAARVCRQRVERLLDPAAGRSLADLLRPHVPELIDEMIAAIANEVPEYNRPLQGTFGKNVRRGTVASLERFLALIAGADHNEDNHRQIYIELGRSELRSGRSLESLLAAYRVGARHTWRRFAQIGRAAGIDAEQLCLLAEALFAYVDALSAESAEGYAQEQSLAAGYLEREREALLELLLRTPAPTPAELQAQAARAGWSLPALITPLACYAEPALGGRLRRRLPAEHLVVAREGLVILIGVDLEGPGRLAQVAGALRGTPAALGPTAAPTAAREAIERAILAAGLRRAGVIEAEGIVRADDHLLTLILHREPARARSFADRTLRPLQELPLATRTRLAETLHIWLDHACDTSAAAQSLHIHPQTLRHRLRRLEQIIGAERLRNPSARLELALALRITADLGRLTGAA